MPGPEAAEIEICCCDNPIPHTDWIKGHEGSCTPESGCDNDCYPPPKGFCLACHGLIVQINVARAYEAATGRKIGGVIFPKIDLGIDKPVTKIPDL